MVTSGFASAFNESFSCNHEDRQANKALNSRKLDNRWRLTFTNRYTVTVLGHKWVMEKNKGGQKKTAAENMSPQLKHRQEAATSSNRSNEAGKNEEYCSKNQRYGEGWRNIRDKRLSAKLRGLEKKNIASRSLRAQQNRQKSITTKHYEGKWRCHDKPIIAFRNHISFINYTFHQEKATGYKAAFGNTSTRNPSPATHRWSHRQWSWHCCNSSYNKAILWPNHGRSSTLPEVERTDCWLQQIPSKWLDYQNLWGIQQQRLRKAATLQRRTSKGKGAFKATHNGRVVLESALKTHERKAKTRGLRRECI